MLSPQVDDCVAIGYGKELANFSKSVDAKYGITAPAEVKWVLGMPLERGRSARTIAISQEVFTDSILTRFNLIDATTVTTPLLLGSHLSVADCTTSQDEIEEMATRPYRELVGPLARLALGTRLGITFATSSPTRFGHDPSRVHWEAAKRVLRYLKGTKKRRLDLGGKSLGIAAFTDADWEATAMIDAQPEHILSRSAMELLAGNPRSSPVSHSRRRKRCT